MMLDVNLKPTRLLGFHPEPIAADARRRLGVGRPDFQR